MSSGKSKKFRAKWVRRGGSAMGILGAYQGKDVGIVWPVLEGIRPATGTRPPRFVILNHLVSDSLRWLSSSRSLSSSSELNDLWLMGYPFLWNDDSCRVRRSTRDTVCIDTFHNIAVGLTRQYIVSVSVLGARDAGLNQDVDRRPR